MDLRRLRNNPKLFQDQLANIEWESLVKMKDVDNMERFWTKQINKCLDLVAPWKSRKINKKSTPCQKKSKF